MEFLIKFNVMNREVGDTKVVSKIGEVKESWGLKFEMVGLILGHYLS